MNKELSDNLRQCRGELKPYRAENLFKRWVADPSTIKYLATLYSEWSANYDEETRNMCSTTATE